MNVLIVSAIRDEVENLSDDFFVTLTGVGKINATATLQTALLALHSQNKKPDVVINYGTAGRASERIEVGELYEVGEFVQRDMLVPELGIEKYQTPFESDCIIKNGRSDIICGTGDNFWKPDGCKDFDVVDMEAYALAHVCRQMNIDFRCFKYISDSGDIDEWKQNVSDGCKIFEEKMNKIYNKECSYECVGRR